MSTCYTWFLPISSKRINQSRLPLPQTAPIDSPHIATPRYPVSSFYKCHPLSLLASSLSLFQTCSSYFGLETLVIGSLPDAFSSLLLASLDHCCCCCCCTGAVYFRWRACSAFEGSPLGSTISSRAQKAYINIICAEGGCEWTWNRQMGVENFREDEKTSVLVGAARLSRFSGSISVSLGLYNFSRKRLHSR